MNPLGGLVAMLGLVLIVIGIQGTQRNVAKALSGARPSAAGASRPATPQPRPSAGGGVITA